MKEKRAITIGELKQRIHCGEYVRFGGGTQTVNSRGYVLCIDGDDLMITFGTKGKWFTWEDLLELHSRGELHILKSEEESLLDME